MFFPLCGVKATQLFKEREVPVLSSKFLLEGSLPMVGTRARWHEWLDGWALSIYSVEVRVPALAPRSASLHFTG